MVGQSISILLAVAVAAVAVVATSVEEPAARRRLSSECNYPYSSGEFNFQIETEIDDSGINTCSEIDLMEIGEAIGIKVSQIFWEDSAILSSYSQFCPVPSTSSRRNLRNGLRAGGETRTDTVGKANDERELYNFRPVYIGGIQCRVCSFDNSDGRFLQEGDTFEGYKNFFEELLEREVPLYVKNRFFSVYGHCLYQKPEIDLGVVMTQTGNFDAPECDL